MLRYEYKSGLPPLNHTAKRQSQDSMSPSPSRSLSSVHPRILDKWVEVRQLFNAKLIATDPFTLPYSFLSNCAENLYIKVLQEILGAKN